MFCKRSTGLATAGLLIALALAGCTASNPYGSGGSGGASATNTPGTGSGPVVVQTATATVGGSSVTILTNGQGRTLYYFDSDSSTQAACTSAGGCTGTWPPLLAPSASSQVQAPSSVPGTFAVVNAGNGTQVEYKGHPLYIYSGDSGPGQTTGNGIEGKWHVATPNIPQNTTGGNNGY